MKIVIYGGGTINPIRNHLAVCAPSFGTTAKYLAQALPHSELKLTKMADSESPIVSNQDLIEDLDEILNDWSVKCVVMSAAVCDFDAQVGTVVSGTHAKRLSSASSITIECTPADKVITRIKEVRPDILVVGFKTTTGAAEDVQIAAGNAQVSADITFCNDTVTRCNVLVKTGSHESFGTCRKDALDCLIDTIKDKMEYFHYRKIDFSGLTICNADFSNEIMRDAKFVNSTLINCSFRGAQLQRTDFTDAKMKDCDFQGADMRGMVHSLSNY